jgi:hypothetical protein
MSTRVGVNKQAVLPALQPLLASRGFELKEAHERFVRSTRFGAQFFQLVFTDRAGALIVSPGAYVRFSQVEHYLNQVSGLDPKDYDQSFSIGIDFWRFFNDKFLRFAAFDEGDIERGSTSAGDKKPSRKVIESPHVIGHLRVSNTESARR